MDQILGTGNGLFMLSGGHVENLADFSGNFLEPLHSSCYRLLLNFFLFPFLLVFEPRKLIDRRRLCG